MQKEKPTWLQVLEAESWQAELLISGLAIYGSLQLPALINGLIDYALFRLPETILHPCYYIFWYLIISSSTLIVSFILHFALRALWIGMIGLVSVFPEGIQLKAENYSEHFMQQVREEFPDVNQFNEQLDKFCSIVFAAAFAVVAGMLSITIVLAVILLIVYLLSLIFPMLPIIPIYVGIVLFLLIPSMFGSILNIKPLREKRWVKLIHFHVTIRILGRLLFNIFYRPIYYIIYIFMTNIKMKKVGIAFYMFLFAVMLISIPVLTHSNALYFRQDFFFNRDEVQDRMYAINYLDQIPEGTAVIRPAIASDVIQGDYLKLFIPIPKREKETITKNCEEFAEDDALSRRENRRLRYALELECAAKSFDLYINDQRLKSTDVSAFMYNHPNQSEPGILFYLSTASFEPGQNVLKIVHTFQSAEKERKESLIPFLFALDPIGQTK